MKREIIGQGAIKVKIAAAVICVLILLLIPCSMGMVQEAIFEMDDPVGDDYGPGTYVYPKSAEFVPGIFDLTNFKVSKTESDVVFEFKYKDLGGNPWGSNYGFSFQFQQVYIDKDGKSGSGRTDTVGANLLVDPANAWEVAITVGPSWEGSEAQANWIIVGTTTHEWEIEVSADEVSNSVIAKVPIALIGEPTNEWVYTVITGSWDTGHMRAIGIEAEDWLGGGADENAIIAGVVPLAYDILVPKGMDQSTVLKSYDTEAETFAVVPAVPPRTMGLLVKILAVIIPVIVAIIVVVVVVIVVKRKKQRGR